MSEGSDLYQTDPILLGGVTHAHLGAIWYHSEYSDVPYSPNQFLALDFFAFSLSKIALAL